ncbi:MAG: hypothetical protein JWO57_4174 [Pseudonocardiales bacterium]|nr:hypothetical protein [Pseudonocardiales bacterium]
MSGNLEWKQVLAAVEADAARAEAALRPTGPPDGSGEWLLAPAVLPPLAEMPPVPEELRSHIESLRERIDALRDELAEALHRWEHPARRPAIAVSASTEPARYVDRRL